MSDDTINLLVKIIITSDFIVSALFCIIYGLVSKWWADNFGRTLMIYQLSMTGVMGISVLTIFVTPHRWMTYLGLAIFALVPIALIGRVWVLIQAVRNPDRWNRQRKHG